MKAFLCCVALALFVPLVWVMSGSGTADFGHSFGVSNAIWLVLLQMLGFVLLCAAILRYDSRQAEGGERP